MPTYLDPYGAYTVADEPQGAGYTPVPERPDPAYVWAGEAWEPDPAPARAERNARLAACDWTRLDDAPLTEEQRAAWAAYRQALRDVPEQPGFPLACEWPVPPT